MLNQMESSYEQYSRSELYLLDKNLAIIYAYNKLNNKKN